MDSTTSSHKFLDILQHIWPYISGFFLTTIGLIKLWHNDRKMLRERIRTLEKLAENLATKSELYSCREEVDAQDANNFEKILLEIKQIRTEAREDSNTNFKQHQDIMKSILRLHQ